MFSNKTGKDEPPKPTVKKGASLPSILASDLMMIGNIHSDGVVDIDGKLEGNIDCQSATIRNHGVVKGDITAEQVHVYGVVKGLIKAKNVQFFKGCRVEGVIIHESLTIEDGAMVDGRFKRVEKVELQSEPRETPKMPMAEEVALPEIKAEPEITASRFAKATPVFLENDASDTATESKNLNAGARRDPKLDTSIKKDSDASDHALPKLNFTKHEDEALPEAKKNASDDDGDNTPEDKSDEAKAPKRNQMLKNLRLISDVS